MTELEPRVMLAQGKAFKGSGGRFGQHEKALKIGEQNVKGICKSMKKKKSENAKSTDGKS